MGIAIIVAAVVTVAYETYAREVLAQETMEKVLETVMGDMFDGQLWVELRSQLLQKKAIRRGFCIRLRIDTDPQLPEHQAILWASVSYRLQVLRAKTEKVRVFHYLDRFMRNEPLKLPRFEHLSTGNRLIDLPSDPGVFDEQVKMTNHPDGLPVIVERKELIYLPGAYNLLMSDLTQLETLQILSIPKGFQVEVNWTLGEHVFTDPEACAVERMLLPGHSIEVRLVRIPTTGVAAPPVDSAIPTTLRVLSGHDRRV